jgi:predicted anti-sigma-YlaC factor YlaD
MKDCGDYSGAIRLYLDRKFRGPIIIEELRAHLEQCRACRHVVEAEEELSCLLKRAQPLYSAPDSLRRRIQRIAGKKVPDMPPKPGR